MGNHFAGGQSAEPSATRQIKIMSDAVEEPGGVKVSGAGGIGDPRHGRRADDMNFALADHYRAKRAPRQGGDFTIFAYPLQRRVEIANLVERENLVFVGEQYIDMMFDKFAQLLAVTLNAKWVG